MEKKYSIALVGATGAVGLEILKLLTLRQFPLRNLKLFASDHSIGKSVIFEGEKIPLQKLEKKNLLDVDVTFFCAGGKVSEAFAAQAVEQGSIVIDNSSAFRMKKDVPLIIPEINLEDLSFHQGIIANPNCSTIIMLMALFPLHKVVPIKRIVAATYQAASGAGTSGMLDLIEDTAAHLQGHEYKRRVMPFPYAFNLFLHNSNAHPSGYNEEELKMIRETKKILHNEDIEVTATCVRVPVLRCHSEALNVEFTNDLSAQQARELLEKAPGIAMLEDETTNRFAMPIDAAGKGEVFCGRIRQDISRKNTLDLWVVADQLLKGAALNAVQIAEHLYRGKRAKNGGGEKKLTSSDVIG